MDYSQRFHRLNTQCTSFCLVPSKLSLILLSVLPISVYISPHPFHSKNTVKLIIFILFYCIFFSFLLSSSREIILVWSEHSFPSCQNLSDERLWLRSWTLPDSHQYTFSPFHRTWLSLWVFFLPLFFNAYILLFCLFAGKKNC